ncbi:MAG: anchored repeat ABC transporter, substrate-binding protein [Acidimicrobiia bacterium]|nr:anchored repeat ABC transporter, substrate-binding protein [Acidimicrobiia bacterium]
MPSPDGVSGESVGGGTLGGDRNVVHPATHRYWESLLFPGSLTPVEPSVHRTPTRGRSSRRAAVLVAAVALLAAACGSSSASNTALDGDVLEVVVSTEIIADLVQQVGGDRVSVHSVVPPGGDPHSYEPTPSDARAVARADVAFTNHLLLEDHALIRLFDANVPDESPNVSLAEQAEQYGANLLPFEEDLGLDVLWLGLAVRGGDVPRSSQIHLHGVSAEGPGDIAVYLTDAFGQPDVLIDTRDGLDADDVATLPPGAHTHVNWAFTAPGVYELGLGATLEEPDAEPVELGQATFTFAVGVPADDADLPGATVLDEGHADIAVSLDTGGLFPCVARLSCADEVDDLRADDVVILVPDEALEEVPDDERFAFLGEPGTLVHQLPQAVLGKHVHGVIDPHLWQDVRNASAYVQLMTDVLAEQAPQWRSEFEANRDAYLEELDELHAYVTDQLAAIPADRRHLITTHDAFSYLADAYGLEVAGFVVPNPAQEPSAVQISRLTDTLRRLEVPAVFLEPNLVARANVLRQVAEDHDIEVCRIYGDAFDPDVQSYVEMMRHNADELLRCLGSTA